MADNLALVAYFISVISLGVSLYVVYLLSDLKDKLRLPKEKQTPRAPIKGEKPKGHWDR
jgi:hypothetical protein